MREARRYVDDELTAAGFEDAVMPAQLLVSELVTNAILHARTPLRVSIEQRGDLVRVNVADESGLRPRTRAHSIDSGTGRGLVLVERMATRWGVEPDDSGKVVWFELPRHPADDVWEDLEGA